MQLTKQEENALNRFIISNRTSEKTKSAFSKVLSKYKREIDSNIQNDINELEEMLEYASDKTKPELLNSIKELKLKL